MFATLMIPSPDGVAQTFTLRLEFRDGHPVFVSSHGHVIEASYFRLMRDRMGASIETDQAPLVAKVLHVAEDEAGLVAVN